MCLRHIETQKTKTLPKTNEPQKTNEQNCLFLKFHLKDLRFRSNKSLSNVKTSSILFIKLLQQGF